MEKEIEINLKSLHIILRDDCAHFIYNHTIKCWNSSLFIESLNLDKSSTRMIILFIDDFLRFSSVFCNINSLNETDFGQVYNYRLVTAAVTYKINVESLVFTHKCSKYIDEYNSVCFEDKLSILQSSVIQLCSDILLDEKRKKIIDITKPEDIVNMKSNWYMRFRCKKCGKETEVLFKPCRIGDHKKMLCRTCNFKQNNLKKYGVESPVQLPEFQEKVKQNNLKKYGVEYPLQSPRFHEKVKQNNLKKYGVEYPLQLPEFQEKINCKYEYFGLRFDSSWELYYYIYQTEILNVNCVRNYGKVCFKYVVNGKLHRYIPDFITENKIVEIKGDHLIDDDNNLIDFYKNRDKDVLLAKTQCMFDNVDEIITRKDIKPMIEVVKQKFGAHYIDQFKINKDEEGLKTS